MKKPTFRITTVFLFFLVFSLRYSRTIEQETNLQHNPNQQIIQSLKALPLYFVENKGQLDDCVKYHLKMPNLSAYFTKDEIVYQFVHTKGEGKSEEKRLKRLKRKNSEKVEIENIRMRFLGANDQLKVDATDEGESKVNYFRGNDPEKWVQGARTYKKVVYRDLYPDIDLIVYEGGGKLKQEYRVKAGGDVEDIRIKYEVVEELKINPDGELEVKLKGGELKEGVPISYQRINEKKVNVQGGYKVMAENVIGFRVGEYKKDRELVIDPALSYSTYIGGSNDEEESVQDIAVDGNGSAYITGYTSSTDFPTSPGVWDTSLDGSFDAFITKLNTTGSALSYSTYLGGNSNDFGEGIAIDGDGNAYVTGGTSSTDFPITPGVYNTIFNGGYSDVFIAKLNSAGTALSYSTYVGGSSNDFGRGIGIDTNGSAYVTGWTSSTDFPTTPGAYDTNYDFGDDVFITKLDSTGSALSYSTFLGGSSDDFGYGIGIDGSGNAFVAGWTSSTNFPTTPGAHDSSLDGSEDVFITKLNAAGSALSYSTYLGGSQGDYSYGNRIPIDGSGSAYITGYTYSTDFPTTSSAFDTSHNGGGDAFITKLDAAGSALSYSTYLGGSDHDYVYGGIVIDGSGNAYLTGSTHSTDFPTTSSAYDTVLGGTADAFLTKLNTTGSSLSYSSYLGGSSYEAGSEIAIDSSGNVYVAGNTLSIDFPTTFGAYDTSYNGGFADIFVTKIDFISFYLPIFHGHDFNGDDISDVSVWRPTNGKWYIKGVGSHTWGQAGDIPANGDYNGDGTTDIAVWRPSNGWWYLRGIGGAGWGTSGDIPVPGNYNGDFNGTTDIAVWRPSNGRWYIKGIGGSVWGTAGDIPVPGDYNGDGTTDIAVWRPSNGRWYIKGTAGSVWGTAGDIPIPADYNGDGVTDIAVWRPSNGRWYIKGVAGSVWGTVGDIPVPGDYNGDGTTDIAVWRASNGRWYIKGIGGYVWGMVGDIPLVR